MSSSPRSPPPPPPGEVPTTRLPPSSNNEAPHHHARGLSWDPTAAAQQQQQQQPPPHVGNGHHHPKPHHHARGVSWDLAIQAGRARAQAANADAANVAATANADAAAEAVDDGVSAVTTPVAAAAVALKDLVGLAPMESEAETLLLHAIEENAAEATSAAAAASSGGGGALTNNNTLTLQEEETLFLGTPGGGTATAGDATSPPSSGRLLPATSEKSLFSKSATKDTTQHLWELAEHLKQQQDHSRRHLAPPPRHHRRHGTHDDAMLSAAGGENDAAAAATGQSDMLASHAVHLWSQRARKRSGGTNTPSSSPSSSLHNNINGGGGAAGAENNQGTNAAAAAAATSMTKSKWNAVRAAVQSNVAMAVEKKTDDQGGAAVASSSSLDHQEVLSNDIEQGGSSSTKLQDGGGGGVASSNNNNNKSNNNMKSKKEMNKEKRLQAEFHAFQQWVRFKKTSVFGYIRQALLFAILPATGIAALLFYVGENPPCGTQEDCLDQKALFNITGGFNATTEGEGRAIDNLFGLRAGERYDNPSVAWWILFIGVRQVITLSLAFMFEAIIIDFWVLKTKTASRLLGPYLSLLIVQAKGWPIQLILWGLLDIGMLYGDRPFARHWLYWQDEIELFNNTNPAGDVTESTQYKTLLSLMCAIGGLVAFKRFFVGLRLGQKTYHRYGADLAKIMKKTILVSEVSTLASEIQKYGLQTEDFGLHTEIYNEAEDDGDGDGNGSKGGTNTARTGKSMSNLTTIAELASEQKIRIAELLGEWEEPELAHQHDEVVDIGSVIQFRKSLSYLDTQFPFSVNFGPAHTRETCVRSAESVFKKLKMATPSSPNVVFDTLALSSIKRDGSLDDHKLRELIRVFRPDREGNLTLMDFCKSVDTVYKELRLFRASVANAARVDRAFEKMVDAVFYFIVGCVALAILGVNPFALFAAISGFILGFAFMIGGACSKGFEGLLMILVTKPYDIGDKIQVAPVASDSSGTGSAYWLVKDVGLYHTTYMFWTQETATCPNGALANTRIINATRSPQAILTTLFKFPIDTPYHKIEVFKNTVEKFVKNRPREWLSFLAFRPTRVEIDGGFVEYIFVAQHRENWANVGALKNSLADVSYFSLEVAKRMDMRYTAPPMPINLNIMGDGNTGGINTPNLPQLMAQQMEAQIANQSSRLQQPALPRTMIADEQQPLMRNRSGGGSTVGSRTGEGSIPQDEEYNFSEIEAMFHKNK